MAAALEAIRTWLDARVDRSEDRGASLVEYALLIAFIAIICVVAVGILGDAASTSFSSTADGFG